MATFTDSKSRTWVLRVNAEVLQRVFAETGFKLLWIFEPEKSKELDALKLFSILWSMVRPQAEGLKVSEDDFREGFGDMDVAERAGAALQDALILFYPSRVRPAMKQLANMTSELGNQLEADGIQAVELLEQDLKTVIAQLREKKNSAPSSSIDSSTATPESAASIPPI